MDAHQRRQGGRIVVGYDGRHGGRDALVLGELLARTLGGGLEIINAGAGSTSAGELESEARATLGPAGAELTFVARDGGAAAVLREAAERDGAELLAIGSTHRAGFGRVVPGTTASRLLGAAACPVAVAPRSFAAERGEDGLAHPLRVIEVGYDASPESVAALEFAARLATAAAATVRVVAVAGATPADVQATGGPAGAYAVSAPFDLQASLHDAVADLPEEARALAIYDRGTAATVLVERATQGVDVIVVGSRGHGRVGTALLGSTSKAVLEAARCPTIVVSKLSAPTT